MMATPYSEIRGRMSPESRARSDALGKKLIAEYTAAMADEDRAMAEEGLAEYAAILEGEDNEGTD